MHGCLAEKAKRLGLNYVGGGGSIKAINLKACSIQGIACGVRANNGTWVGNLNFLVVDIDDYAVILEMEFFY